jgi:hypothetical protein
MSSKCKFIKIILHHSKAATTFVCRKLATQETYIALIKELWVYKDQTREFQGKHCFLLDLVLPLDPACLSGTQSVHAFALLEPCSRDVMIVRMIFTSRWGKRKLTVISVYLSCDSNQQ